MINVKYRQTFANIDPYTCKHLFTLNSATILLEKKESLGNFLFPKSYLSVSQSNHKTDLSLPYDTENC